MYPKKEPGTALLQRAGSRAGVLTSKDLYEFDAPAGARRRWIREWSQIGHGYYCVQPPTFESWCWAGLLRAGDTGAITGQAAGHLYGFVQTTPSLITVYHQRCEPLGPMGDESITLRFRRGFRASRGTPARTGTEVALLDLARESDRNQTIDALTRALGQRMTTPARLLNELKGIERLRHQALIREICEEAVNGVESVLEWLFLTDVLRRHGLPEGRRQEALLPGTRSDIHFEEFGFVVELDGRLGHEDEAFRDMERDNRLAARGVITLRFGWHDVVTRPCVVAAQIVELLKLKGWNPQGRRCRRCS